MEKDQGEHEESRQIPDGGWFRCYRKAFSAQDLYWGESRPRTKWEAWMDLINLAAFVDHEVMYDGSVIRVKRGQVPTSERRLAERWGWGRQRVRGFLRQLEKIGRISRERTHGTTHGFTLVSINNYRAFQDVAEGQKPAPKPTKDPRTTQTEEGKEGEDHVRARSEGGVVVMEFVHRSEGSWVLKSSPDDWFASLSYPGVHLIPEIRRAADWWEEAIATGLRQPCRQPTRALHYWLRNAKTEQPAPSGFGVLW